MEAIEKIFEEENSDIVVNFAAESHVDRGITNSRIFLESNIIGTAVLIDECRKYVIERYHQVSTNESYGDLLLIDLICSFTRILLCIQVALIAYQRHLLICCLHITAPMVCL